MSKLLLIILDGWGIGPANEHNAIYAGQTPFFDSLFKKAPTSVLQASGEAVGLLSGQIGSSEVGHMHIGAGRIIRQELTRITHCIENGDFFQNSAFLEACALVKRNKSRLHFMGLESDGGVHSHEEHLYALIKLAKIQNIDSLYIHAFLDGRDSPPASSEKYIVRLEETMQKERLGKLATICGRFYAMDRNNNWALTSEAVNLLTKGVGKTFENANQAIEASYKEGTYDEFVKPIILDARGVIKQNDAIICFNFRADRMRQLVVELSKTVPNLHLTTMIPYGVNEVETRAAFIREEPSNHLCQVLSSYGVSYLKIAETQKYPHLTYFFNGTREEPYTGEERIMVPSKDVATFDLCPEMSAQEITEAALANFGKYPVIMINFANVDMVGHTGNLKAGIAACECVDKMLERLCGRARENGYTVMITADHGNAEEMYDHKNDSVHTAHTVNPVPFILLSDKNYQLKKQGSLINIAPTMLSMLGIQKPIEMGEGLL